MPFLIKWSRGRKLSHPLAMRAKIVLMSSEGRTDVAIAQALRFHVNTARKWRLRFIRDGHEGLNDAPRSGKPRKHDHVEIRVAILKTILSESALRAWHRSDAGRPWRRGWDSPRTSSGERCGSRASASRRRGPGA
ncbi:MAG: helix-turn-helix domain-containing protein [Deltaproteobacteria bacterium]|nr:helix-turn-helix domain-containing protein [Deltaproteobacteria bacterium]